VSKQDPIVDLAKLHFLVDLCGGGMAEFAYRNATQLSTRLSATLNGRSLVLASSEYCTPGGSLGQRGQDNSRV
jgi:hypothetical protein